MAIKNIGDKIFSETTSGLMVVGSKVFFSEGGGGGGGGGGSANSFTQSICLVNKTSFIKRNCKWLQKQ